MCMYKIIYMIYTYVYICVSIHMYIYTHTHGHMHIYIRRYETLVPSPHKFLLVFIDGTVTVISSGAGSHGKLTHTVV